MIKIGNLNIDRKDLVCTAVLLLILLVSSIVVCLKVNTIILKVWLIIITIYILGFVGYIYHFGVSNIFQNIRDNKIKYIFLLIVTLFLLRTLKFELADVKELSTTGKAIISFNLVFFPAILIAISRLLRKDYSLEKVFVIFESILGIMFMLILPTGTVPDEVYHAKATYTVSNMLMGIHSNEESEILVRENDAIFFNNDAYRKAYLTRDDFEHYIHSYTESAGKTNLVGIRFYGKNVYSPAYFVPAIGLTFGRILGLNTAFTFLLARLFNLLFYIGIGYFAIKLLPFGKKAAVGLSLMPMAIHQAMSLSYDVFVNITALFIIAATLHLAFQEEERKRFIILGIFIALFALILFNIKSHAYFLVSFFPLLVLALKKISLSVQQISILKKIVFVGIVLFIVGFFALYFTHFFQNLPYNPTYITLSGSIPKTESYSVSYFITHPTSLFRLFLSTFRVMWKWYIVSFIGGYLGWLDFMVPSWTTSIYLFLLIVLSLKRIEEEKILQRKYKISFMGISILTVLFIVFGMAISWTVLTSPIVEGVQGRYFIPIAPLVLMCIPSNYIMVDQKYDKYIISVMAIITLYTVQCIFIGF